MSDALLEIRRLACARDGRELFADLELVVEAGQCVELTGPNGSGKTTLLRCISGLFPDYQGTIEKRDAEYLGHKAGTALALSARENLRWYQRLNGAAVDLDALLARVGLPGYEDEPVMHLSAGQQRRVAIARLLIGGRRLWLLDEPFTALDVDGQAMVRRMLTEHLREGGAAVCATHQSLGMEDCRALKLGVTR